MIKVLGKRVLIEEVVEDIKSRVTTKHGRNSMKT
jgi:hypothetical protein